MQLHPASATASNKLPAAQQLLLQSSAVPACRCCRTAVRLQPPMRCFPLAAPAGQLRWLQQPTTNCCWCTRMTPQSFMSLSSSCFSLAWKSSLVSASSQSACHSSLPSSSLLASSSSGTAHTGRWCGKHSSRRTHRAGCLQDSAVPRHPLGCKKSC